VRGIFVVVDWEVSDPAQDLDGHLRLKDSLVSSKGGRVHGYLSRVDENVCATLDQISHHTDHLRLVHHLLYRSLQWITLSLEER
jgi:hypothetical protein